jgi:UDP-N-acetylglucosamine diphosphorylase / glucose-1-phosphate thymidylyltransferase / UDP-N-acetylgalactosamine diphosphorylase / glucosamine-1-phosphate N-acetyltransferase / galactosamine-1-phosphate N-acetyltransferase
MKALILAAGEGTRLRPLTSNTPKPLLLVAGKPYLSHLFSALKSAGIVDIALLVGFKSNRIRECYGEGASEGIKITYLEQKERLGTANAIGVAEGMMDEGFVCINGDVVLTEKDIIDVVEAYRQHHGTIMATVAVEDPTRFGVIEESKGKMLRIVEKPKVAPSNMINAGLFVFNPDVFDYIRRTEKSPRGEYEITDTLNMMAAKIDINIHRLRGPWMDVGRPWDLLKANEILMAGIERRIEGVVEEGATLKGNVVVEKGALVRAGSYIEGPVYISSGCDIGPNCYIRPSTCLGKNVRIGASVEVKNSIVMNGTHIPHHNYVGDSIVGERCNFGAGTKVANLRFDNKSVKVSFKGDSIDAGTRKLGVIMGDDVKTGINSMIEPGTIIWERSIVGMGAVAKGEIGPDSRIF